MNDSEARRRELLRQTRKLYDENAFIPAVHPRYRNVYQELYGPDGTQEEGSSFYIRLMIGILAFFCFVWMDYQDIKVSDVDSKKIVNQIEKQMDLEEIQEVWKNL